jgi:hypothetical protein
MSEQDWATPGATAPNHGGVAATTMATSGSGGGTTRYDHIECDCARLFLLVYTYVLRRLLLLF